MTECGQHTTHTRCPAVCHVLRRAYNRSDRLDNVSRTKSFAEERQRSDQLRRSTYDLETVRAFEFPNRQQQQPGPPASIRLPTKILGAEIAPIAAGKCLGQDSSTVGNPNNSGRRRDAGGLDSGPQIVQVGPGQRHRENQRVTTTLRQPVLPHSSDVPQSLCSIPSISRLRCRRSQTRRDTDSDPAHHP